MKIECLLHREGGSLITIGDSKYHFVPGPDGRHVAEVADPDHLGIFLSIREGYRLVSDDSQGVPATAIPVVTPANDGEGDKEKANDASTLTPKEEEKAEKVDPYDQKGGPDGDVNTLDREEVARAYEEKFGRRPHGKWSAERILAELKV